MNINQHFNQLVTQTADKNGDLSALISQRDKLFESKIVPAIKAKNGNNVDIANARKNWKNKTDQSMRSAGLIPAVGQSQRSFEKDKRAERRIQESARTGSIIPILKETAQSTVETIGNAFGQGVGSMIESTAGFINDIGENEKDSTLAGVAKYGANLRKGYEESASTIQKEMQAGKHGKAAQLSVGAVQSMPAMALPAGTGWLGRIGAAKVLPASMAKAAPWIGAGAGVAAGHTQNYGDVRRQATQQLQKDFPNWQSLQNNPEFQQRVKAAYDNGVDLNQARIQTHAQMLDEQSENYADKAALAMTAVDMIAPSEAVIGSGLLKTQMGGRLGKALVGKPNSTLVNRALNEGPRVGIARLMPDVSIAGNKAAASMVGRQFLEEGLQGGIGEYAGQAASADMGGSAVKWGQVGQSFIDEGLMGAVMGGGMQSISGNTAHGQAKAIATEIRNQTNRVRQEEQIARKELADATASGDQAAIQSAQEYLQSVGAEAAKIKTMYDEHGIDVPYFISSRAQQFEQFQKSRAEAEAQADAQAEAVPPEDPTQVDPNAAPQPAQPRAKTEINQGQADFTQAIMNGVSSGKIGLDEAQAIQQDPLRAQVFQLASMGDLESAHNVVMNAAAQGQIDIDQSANLVDSIQRYAGIQPKKTLSSIVDQHIQQQPAPVMDDGQPQLTDFDYQPSASGIVPNDGSMQEFNDTTPASPAEGYQQIMQSTQDSDLPLPDMDQGDHAGVPPVLEQPTAPTTAQAPDTPLQPKKEVDFSQPKTFSNAIRAREYIQKNGLKDSHETVNMGGQVKVQPKAAVPTPEPTAQPEAEPTTTAQEPEENLSFADKIRDAHLNNPNAKAKLINDEIAKGRPRAEVLAEVTDIVKGMSKPKDEISDLKSEIKPKSEPKAEQTSTTGGKAWLEQDHSSLPDPFQENELKIRVRAVNAEHNTAESFNAVIEQDFPTLFKNAQDLAKSAELNSIGRRGTAHLYDLFFKDDSSYQSGDPWQGKPSKDDILQTAIWHLANNDESNKATTDAQEKPKLPTLESKEFNQQPDLEVSGVADDIGRASDNAPFANEGAANIALRKKGLVDTHTVVRLAPSQFVLRDKSKVQHTSTQIDLSDPVKLVESLIADGRKVFDSGEPIKQGHEVTFTYKEKAAYGYARLGVDLQKNDINEIITNLDRRIVMSDPYFSGGSKNLGSNVSFKYKYGLRNGGVKKLVISPMKNGDIKITATVDSDSKKMTRLKLVEEPQEALKAQEPQAAKPTEKATDDVQELDQTSGSTLEGVPSEDVPAVQGAGNPTAKTEGSSRTDVSGSGRAGNAGDRSSHGVADGEGEVSLSTRGTDSNQGLDPKQAIVADNLPLDAFVIEGDIAKGGKKTKFKANIEAIKTIKLLEQEQRPATKAEQKVLSQFVGWGGLAEAFKREDGSISKGWDKEVAELEQLLTKEEYQAAVDSSIAAHYTSPEIVNALWKAIDQFGFKNGRVLEPAVGVGNFFGLMPKSMRKASQLHAVELDNITGAIAKNLYPEANIKAPMGFQDYQTLDNYFDVAIGNPPFSSIQVADRVRPAIHNFSLHNYFFAKSVDSLKPNGVLAMVVTNRFLDKMGDKERSYIAERADLIGAIRLPNDAFLSNAGTQVTTDIIFLRKKAEGENQSGESWINVKSYKDKNGAEVPLNEYFVRHPENMLGDFGAFGSMYRANDSALVKREGQNTEQLLAEAISRLPKDVFKAEASKVEETRKALIQDISEVKVGARFVVDGEVHERLPDVMGEQQSEVLEFANDKAKARVMGMIETVNALAEVRKLQLDPTAKDKPIEAARKQLNAVYDAFVKEHGFINSDSNKRLMRDDPNWPQLAALEDNYDRGMTAQAAKAAGQKFRKPSADKAAIFSKRTQTPIAVVESVSNAKDALTESLNRHGYISTSTMTTLYNKSESEIISELGDLVYDDPVEGYVTRDEYLSGNVKKKLAIAKEHAEINPRYQRNVMALEKVIPAEIEALDIDVKAGAHWIPTAYVAEFVSYITGSPKGKAEYAKLSNKWEITPSGVSAAAEATYATDRLKVSNVLTHALNGTRPTVYDYFSDGSSQINQQATLEASQRVEMVKSAWKDWIWEDDARREHIQQIYNGIFNTTVNRGFDGSHLSFQGMTDAIELRPHQKNAVWRAIQSPSTLFDHTVGAGKTFTVIAAAMEMRRMGTATKPLIVVPNHLVGQWASDFITLYPNANILAATKKDFEKANRKKFIAKMANGDYDAIIIAHSSFSKISISPEQEQQFIDKEIADLMAFEAELREQKGSKSRNAKDIGKRRQALEEKKKNLLNRENKDTDNIYWHELGIDSIMLDEAHEFKNLEFTTSMQNVAGLGNGKGSQKAKDLFAKIQLMQSLNPKSKIIFATGTPISNTMAEMFTMQRYLSFKDLQSKGIDHFDAWAKVFGEVVSDWELSPSGKYKLTNRFAKFVNMPELMQGYLSFSDVMNRDDINAQLAREGKTLGTPKLKGGKPQNIVVERSDEQADFIGVPTVDEYGFEQYPEGSLVWRTENLPRKPEKGADNMLKIMGDARKAALDMRLVDPTAPDYEGSKVNESARRIYDTYKKWNAKKGTQLVFCDLSTPKGAVASEKARIEQLIRQADQGDEAAQTELDKLSPDELSALDSDFSVYDDLKAKLIAKGIPEAQIAFIHDAKTELQKQALFEKVKRGDIRVLMGSTAKMGAGMNVQNKLVALHHLDAPWRPSDLEQREGRIIRQGNEFYKADPEGFEVEVLRYATKQTLDSRMWQTIESKAKFIEQVRKGTGTAREVEDVAGEAANAAEMKAASSGDPRILEEMDLRKKIKDLEDDKKSFDRNQHRTKGIIKQVQAEISHYRNRTADLAKDLEIQQPEKFVYNNGKTRINQEDKGAREDIATQFATGIDNALVKGQEQYLGELNGFKISAAPSQQLGRVNIFITGKTEPYRLDNFDALEGSTLGLVQRSLNYIKSLRSEHAEAKEALAEAQKQLPVLQQKVDSAKWDKFDQLVEMKVKHDALIEELKPKKREPEQEQTKQMSRMNHATNTGTTVDQVEQAIIAKFGQDVFDSLKKKGLMKIIPTYTEKGVEGFAENGTVTLVADHLTSDSIIPTFLHELGGHIGFQGVLTKNAYKNLMQDFDRLVAQKNPIALEAKRLAERESDTQVQQDEYLPYLVTAAAKAQAQMPAVKRLLNRILSAVKAWAVGKLGLDLKLNANDILALSERMVKQIGSERLTLDNAILYSKQDAGRRYSRNSTGNPSQQSRSKQRELFEQASQTAMGQFALRNLERSKTVSGRTLSLFNTMLHKALTDKTGQFKRTFDLVQDKINHVTFASSKSMDAAPSVLTQLEEGSDYLKEISRVGRAVGSAATGGKIKKAKVDRDLDKVGKFMFENTLLDDSERHTNKQLRQLGFDEDQIKLYDEIRDSIDTSLDTFAKTTFSNIYKHLGGTTPEILALEAKDLEMHQHYNEVLKMIDTLTKGDPEKATARQTAIESLDKVKKKAESLKEQGYMPLMRFGKYFYRIYNPTTGDVSFRQHFDSESERNLESRKVDPANIPAGYKLEVGQINELQHKLFQGVSPETVALFAKESGIPLKGAESEYIKLALKNNHALKRLLKRQGIEGFSLDVKRVLASFVLSNARYAANQTYNPAIDESITEIQDPAYQEDAIRLRDYALDTQEELAGLKNFAFVWYMGFSAMFGVVNLTQPLLQTLPYLMQYSTDYGITGKAFMNAIKTWSKGTDVMDAKYKKHYERARREGHLDPQNTWMLQGQERGKSGLGAGVWQLISHSSGLFAQASETVNRRTTLFAALDVAENLGQKRLQELGFKDAYDFAIRTIQETQGIYNKGNRPRVARGNIGSILMMYKQFMLSYLEQMVRMQKSGLYGGGDDEFKKKMAALVGFGVSRSVLLMLGTLFAFSGFTGMPFVRDALDVIETAGGMIGKPVNTERAIQVALHDALGQTLGGAVNTVFMDGLVNLNPLIDVKGRMGMGDLIPATAYFSPTTSEYQKGNEAFQIGGAIGGLVDKFSEAVALAQVGSYGMAAVQTLPKAITSVGQGANAAITGDYRNMKTGVKTNDATVTQGIMKMLDAQPAQIAKEGRVRGLEMKDKAVRDYLNKRWKDKFENALESEDPERIAKVKADIEQYNKDNPRYPITFNQKRAVTNFEKSNQSWQEKRKNVKGYEWMDQYNPYLEEETN